MWTRVETIVAPTMVKVVEVEITSAGTAARRVTLLATVLSPRGAAGVRVRTM